LRAWGLPSLAEDAEIIVGELAANAVTHGARPGGDCRPGQGNLGLRLRRGTSEVICAVLDPSDTVPVLKAPGGAEHSGRGLQMVDVLSDVWGWSPVARCGKAVWAVLFVPHGRADGRWGVPSQGAR
jgi:anti-sigma regulatory factor (Ser/Thr protein kinase)